MTAPRPPSLKEIEEDLAAAPHTDPAFSLPTNGDVKTVRTTIIKLVGLTCFALFSLAASRAEDEVMTVAQQAVQFVPSHQRLKENYAHSLPHTLRAVEQHIAELRTAIGGGSPTSK